MASALFGSLYLILLNTPYLIRLKTAIREIENLKLNYAFWQKNGSVDNVIEAIEDRQQFIERI
jgi:hypothetical protein